MPQRIDKLTIRAFRGASETTELVFDASTPACMLFGENGTGKSSIVDAIEFVCNGTFGSLDSCKLGRGKRKHDFLPSLGKRSNDLRVAITSGATEWSATLGGSSATLCNTPNRPRAWILRRAELLAFVEADPSERYRTLASYIAVQEIEKSEDTLSEACKDIDRQVASAMQATEQAQAALQEFWEGEGRPAPSRDEWAAAEAEKDSTDLAATVSACRALTDAATDLTGKVTTRQSAQEHATAKHDALTAAESALAAGMASHADGTKELLETLKDAKAFIDAAPDATSCPVCERPIDTAALGPKLATRITELDALDRLVQSRDAAKRASDQAATQLATARHAVLEAARRYAALAAGSTLTEVVNVAVDWARFSALVSATIPLSDPSAVSQAAAFEAHAEAIRTAAQTRLDADQKSLNQLNGIKQHVKTVEDKTKELAELHEVQQLAKKAYGIVKDSRKSFVDQLLVAVSGEVDGLYTRLHPGEALGGLTLYLDPNQRGSLKFDARFETETAAPPQAYYSESHLDTMGVCIFLALAKKFAKADSFVVMDDVFTSVDQVHLDRLIRLIHDEVEHLNQLLLTTHYRPWRDAYRYYRGPALRIQLIELLPWTLQRGVRHTKSKLVVDELRECVAREPIDRQVVASKAGILLEGLLDHFTLLYECRVPRRGDSRYTLGDLLNAIDSKLKRSLTVSRAGPAPDAPAVETELKDSLDELESTAWIRNEVGCHFNLDANIADADVKRFANRVVQLAEAVICNRCGELPRNDRSGTDRKCRCGQVRMQPVEAPR